MSASSGSKRQGGDDEFGPLPPSPKRPRLNSEADKVTGRPRTACDYCRRIKAKCDGETPCSLCVKRGRSEACAELEYLTVVGRNEIVQANLRKGKRRFACAYCKQQIIKCSGSRPCEQFVERNEQNACFEAPTLTPKNYGAFKILPKVFEENPITDQMALDFLAHRHLKWFVVLIAVSFLSIVGFC
jgi:hypothetical protein